MRLRVAVGSGIGALLVFAGAPAVTAQSVTTAQSVMFATEMTGNFVMRDTEVWEFDHAAAKTFFTNAWRRASCATGARPIACRRTSRPRRRPPRRVRRG